MQKTTRLSGIIIAIFLHFSLQAQYSSGQQYQYDPVSNPSGTRFADFAPKDDGRRNAPSTGSTSLHYAPDYKTTGLQPKNRGKLWGYVDTKGKWVIEPKYIAVGYFNNGSNEYASTHVCIDLSKGLYRYIDRNGKFITEPYVMSELGRYGGVALGEQPEERGKRQFMINTATTDTILLPDGLRLQKNADLNVYKYPYLLLERNGVDKVAAVLERATMRIVVDNLDRCEKVQDFFDGKIDSDVLRIKQDGKYGFVDMTGKLIVAPQYDWAEYFNNGISEVTLNGTKFKIDRTGKRVN